MQQGDVTIVVSPAFIDELHDVLHRPKFRRWFPLAVASRTVVEVRRAGEMHRDALAAAPITREPGDDYLVRLARAARADCLVTGDGDVLAADVPDVWILEPAAFARELQLATLTTEHFFYVDRQVDAVALEAALHAAGALATVEQRTTGDARWLVMAYTGSSTRGGWKHFEELATRHSAEYDGRGTYVGPLQELLPPDEG